jgi:hypothetical protein
MQMVGSRTCSQDDDIVFFSYFFHFVSEVIGRSSFGKQLRRKIKMAELQGFKAVAVWAGWAFKMTEVGGLNADHQTSLYAQFLDDAMN